MLNKYLLSVQSKPSNNYLLAEVNKNSTEVPRFVWNIRGVHSSYLQYVFLFPSRNLIPYSKNFKPIHTLLFHCLTCSGELSEGNVAKSLAMGTLPSQAPDWVWLTRLVLSGELLWGVMGGREEVCNWWRGVKPKEKGNREEMEVAKGELTRQEEMRYLSINYFFVNYLL